MFHKQLPEAEETNGRNGPTWKWIVGILILICAFLVGLYINTTEGKIETLHKRVNKVEDHKLDKEVWLAEKQSLCEKLDSMKDDLKYLIRMQKKNGGG